MTIEHEYGRLGVPTTLLGMRFNVWTRHQIEVILDHYQWRYDKMKRTKIHLMHALDMLVQEHGLDTDDRREIFKASRRGNPLPRCKPRIHRVSHTALPRTARRASARKPHQTQKTSQPAVEATVAATHQAPYYPGAARNIPRECVVCFETLNAQTVPERRITSSCNHEPDVCRSCLATSISTQFDSKVWDQINCPTCDQRLDFQDVKAFAPLDVFARLESLFDLIHSI